MARTFTYKLEERRKVKDQHKHIKGYRDLNEYEIEMMNYIKQVAATVGQLVDELRDADDTDQRWVSIGTTDLQKGFMALVRSVAKPTGF